MAVRLGTDSLNEPYPDLYLSEEARSLGSYVIGTTGTGKTTFLKSLILQDIDAGAGVCVLDPHGDLIDDLLLLIPEKRACDVVLLDPADTERPFALNLFDCNRDDAKERDLVTSTVMDTFYKLFEDSWGHRMADLLRNSIHTLLYVPDSTLLEMMLLLTDHFHRERLKKVACESDPVLWHFWENFPPSQQTVKGKWYNPNHQTELTGSSLNKIGRFLVNPVLRNIVVQPNSTVNFRHAMDNQQIVLVNLSKGDLGSDNSSFLGSILVNQLLIAALSRRDIPLEQRVPFYLYVDEYQNFATKTFPQLQSEARKYHVVTTVAHQYRAQLDLDSQGSTLNVANLFVFRVSGKDAQELAPQFDNIPDPPSTRYQPLFVDLGNGLSAPYKLPSGEQVSEEVELPSRPYSDVERESANKMVSLPQRTAIVRILQEENGMSDGQYPSLVMRQFRMRIYVPSLTERPEIAKVIRVINRRRRKPRKMIEKDIHRRMAGGVTPEISVPPDPREKA